jgi:hypothetical protein
MAVAGNSEPALHIARVNGHYYVIHGENRPAHTLLDVDAARKALLNGSNVWIRASDRVLLAAELKTDIRSIQTKTGA